MSVNLLVAGVALAAPLFVLPLPASPPPSLPSITDIVAASGGQFDNNKFDYDILLNAVLAADLAEALDNPDADLTVFAPNDKAFIRLARDLGFAGWSEQGAWEYLVEALTDLGGGDPIPVLTQVLLYHVAPESLSASEVLWIGFSGDEIVTLQGGTIRPYWFKLQDNEPDLTDPRLTWPLNIGASNGIIHNINRVLLPLDLP